MSKLQTNAELLNIELLKNLKSAKIAIVSTQWNTEIISELKNGAFKIVNELDAEIVDNVSVPGCFELPYGCRTLWNHYDYGKGKLKNRPEAIIAFGAVIRGDTPHFDYVCKAVTEGISQLNLILPIPIIFGVLTVNNEAQAWERLGGIHGHKGEEAAITAFKMILFKKNLFLEK